MTMSKHERVFPELVSSADLAVDGTYPEAGHDAFAVACDLWGGYALGALAFLAGMLSVVAFL
jgi:hypothetical protein